MEEGHSDLDNRGEDRRRNSSRGHSVSRGPEVGILEAILEGVNVASV